MRFGGIVLAALLVLGACSSDPEPKEPRPSATPTATPTGSPPTMPPQAAEDSPEGAAAFVKHYVDVFNYAAATGDVTELSRLSAPTCDGCQSYIKLYKDTYAAGGYFKGGDWRLGDLRLEIDSGETFLTSKVEVADGTGKTATGKPETTEAGEVTTVSFAAKRNSGGWRLSQIGLGAVE